jgi:hypothetical protein
MGLEDGGFKVDAFTDPLTAFGEGYTEEFSISLALEN